MGLDTFASRTSDDTDLSEKDMKTFEEAKVKLCGGILGGASSGFRGKIYDRAISHLTGISLYQAWIPSKKLQKYAAHWTSAGRSG